MKKILCVGWDVGGMHGANNAMVFVESNMESIEIKDLIHFKKEKAAELLAQQIALRIISCQEKYKTILLAIDAPLSFPKAFIRQIQNIEHIQPLDFKDQMHNPLAFRACETFLYEKTGKRPLSSSFDQLTSLTILVLRVFEIMKAKGVKLNILPYNSTKIIEGINAFECYPGNLKPGKIVRNEQMKFWEWAEPFFINSKNEHLHDALLCALFAAFENSKPKNDQFKISQEFNAKASVEGWIYGFY